MGKSDNSVGNDISETNRASIKEITSTHLLAFQAESSREGDIL
jgi:hypothetical protein